MSDLIWKDLAVHNAAELREVDGGVSPQRVTEEVRLQLEEGAQLRSRFAAGVELRFVADGPVEIELSTPAGDGLESPCVSIFHGRYQRQMGFCPGGGLAKLSTTPYRVRIQRPASYEKHRDALSAPGDFSPDVIRVLLPHLAQRVTLHDVYPDQGVTIRPPRPDELPDKRILFYGTSITHGACASLPHLTYPQLCTALLSADALNLGVGGACRCEPAFVDFIAKRDDWDAAVLPLSVNMKSMEDDEFQKRMTHAVHTIAGSNPDRPVACITLWPFYDDLSTTETDVRERAERLRQYLRDAVASCPTPNAHLLEGPELLQNFSGLTCDLIHPGDAAMFEMASRLAGKLKGML